MNNYDPWHMLENVSEKNYKNSATNKPQNLDNIIKGRWEKALYFSYPTSRLLSTYLDVFSFEPWRSC